MPKGAWTTIMIIPHTNQRGTLSWNTIQAFGPSHSNSTYPLLNVPRTRKQRTQASCGSLALPLSPAHRSVRTYFYNLFFLSPRSDYLAQNLCTSICVHWPFYRSQCGGLGHFVRYMVLGNHSALNEGNSVAQ